MYTKRIGCAIVLTVCSMATLCAGGFNEKALDARVTAAANQLYYTDATRFLMSISAFQQHAFKSELDKDGIIQGVDELATAFLTLEDKNSTLFMLEMYRYLDRSVASGGNSLTIGEYLLKVAKIKRGSNEHGVAQRFMRLYDKLSDLRQLYRRNYSLIWALIQARAEMAQTTLDTDIVQQYTPPHKLTQEQVAQVTQTVAKFQTLVENIEKINPEFVSIFVEGLYVNEFKMKGPLYLNLGKFLATYGRFSSNQEMGVRMASTGEWLVKYMKKWQ